MKNTILFFVFISLLVVSACSSNASGTENFPTKPIEFVAPATPGGGWDLTARSMQKILQEEELIENPINVVNKPGGGGEVGWKYLEQQDAHVSAVNSSLLITNNLLGQSDLTYEDFTPLAILSTEWTSIAVPTGSELENATEVMEKLKEDPASLKIGVAPSLGNSDHLSFIEAALTYGVDVPKLEFLVYESGGDVVTALVGGHVDVATMSISEAKEQYKAEKINILAVSSEERVEGLEEVPTWKEQGVDMVFPHWRGIMGPPDMTEEEIAYWDEKIGEMVESESWKEILANNEWTDYYHSSEETKEFFNSETEKYNELLKSSGLVQE